MQLDLDKKNVLITGSSKGIGRGIAEEFLKEKANTILTGRNQNDLENTYEKFSDIYGKQRVHKFIGDLTAKNTLNDILSFFSGDSIDLDHIVCNIGSGESVASLDEDLNEFNRMLDINLLNSVNIVNKLFPIIKRSNPETNSFPSITFVGSICGVEMLGCPVAYASAKSALLSYAKNISHPMGRKGIRVNVVTPGNILFDGSTWEKKILEDPKKVKNMLKNEVPLQCFGDIEDVATIVVFLASKRAKFVNGANWIVDGGQTRS